MPDPSKPNELVPIRKFPRSIIGQETVSDPPLLDESLPLDADEERIIASGIIRRTKIAHRCSQRVTTSLLL